MTTQNQAIAQAKALKDKLDRLASLNKSYAFRLAAIVASDCRPGKVWS
jgi:hypothetical protein